ncbi:unnamed protein product [Allacma fusca]|uniref:Uncharacterized protein n=1 Tax=Allacma fusca TaxID=39272 RepID=A0A8J2LSC9_9HEXA|nr:unnamed protein product [Allacma fusca]
MFTLVNLIINGSKIDPEPGKRDGNQKSKDEEKFVSSSLISEHLPDEMLQFVTVGENDSICKLTKKRPE